MPSQEFDQGIRRDADDHREHQPGGELEVPQPRSPSAARLLELTARDTDRWRSDALAEAVEIVAAAREEAGALVRAAQREAEDLLGAARLEASRAVDEARATAAEVTRETEQQRHEAEAEVARLQQVAADHSQQLRRHLDDMLHRLDSAPGRPASGTGDDS